MNNGVPGGEGPNFLENYRDALHARIARLRNHPGMRDDEIIQQQFTEISKVAQDSRNEHELSKVEQSLDRIEGDL